MNKKETDSIGKGLFHIVVSAAMLICAAGYYFFLISAVPEMMLEGIQYGRGPEVFVQVQPGKNASRIAKDFSATGVVDDPAALAFWLVRFGADRTIQPGTYSIRKGSPWEVAKQMKQAEPETDLLTLLPGTTWKSILDTHSINSEELTTLLEDDSNYPSNVHALLPDSARNRLAFLFPDTYQVVPGESGFKQLIQSASKAWWEKIGARTVESKVIEEADELLKIAIVASLVEKETGTGEERPLIAGVIENRLREGMPLQIDATIVYAWSLRGEALSRVLHRHLEIDSPYNTYKIPGLPPGPICIPSEEAWEAALRPEKTPYLFYVADTQGRHRFSRTYGEHLKAIREIRMRKN
ncbi:MAG: endolytic transglycosylase MltG [Thermovirgaceae bacterium]